MREHLRVSDAAWHRKRGGMGSHTVLAAEWDRRRFYAIGILTGSGERIDEWRHTQQEEAASSTQSTSGGLQARARSRARSRERGRSSRGDTEGRRSVRAPRATRAHLEAQRMAAQKTSDERLFAAILTRSIALIGEQYQHRAPYCEACSQGDCVGHWWNDPQEISRIPGRHLLPGYHTTEQNQASGESGMFEVLCTGQAQIADVCQARYPRTKTCRSPMTRFSKRSLIFSYHGPTPYQGAVYCLRERGMDQRASTVGGRRPRFPTGPAKGAAHAAATLASSTEDSLRMTFPRVPSQDSAWAHLRARVYENECQTNSAEGRILCCEEPIGNDGTDAEASRQGGT